MKPERILVTGGLGAIGRRVVRLLAAGGAGCVVLDWAPDTSRLGQLPGVSVITADVRDAAAVDTAVATHGVRRIIHLAAILSERGQREPSLSATVNIMGFVNVAEAAMANGVERVVYASSRGVYGSVSPPHGHPDYAPVDESHPRNPATVYGVAKAMMENLAAAYTRLSGVEFTGLRFPAIYGPGRDQHGKVALISRLVEHTLRQEPLSIPRGAEQRDDQLYVEDAARATVQAALAPGRLQPVYCIGSGRLVRLADFVTALADLGYPPVVQVGPGLDPVDRGGSAYSLHDITRARSDFGYSPTFDLAAGVKDYVEFLRMAATRDAG